MNDRIDHLLQQQQPLPTASQDLHDSIMRAVKASNSESAGQVEGAHVFTLFTWPRLAYGLAIALIVASSAFLLVRQVEHRAPRSASAAVVPKLDPALTAQLQATWNLMDEVGTNAPAFLARPITRQLDQLSSDFHKTTEMLLASLPMPQSPQPEQ